MNIIEACKYLAESPNNKIRQKSWRAGHYVTLEPDYYFIYHFRTGSAYAPKSQCRATPTLEDMLAEWEIA